MTMNGSSGTGLGDEVDAIAALVRFMSAGREKVREEDGLVGVDEVVGVVGGAQDAVIVLVMVTNVLPPALTPTVITNNERTLIRNFLTILK